MGWMKGKDVLSKKNSTSLCKAIMSQIFPSMLAMSPTSSMAKIFTTTLFAVTVCAICNTVDMVIPCQACHRSQCMSCFSPNVSDPICDGCRLERLLGVDETKEVEADADTDADAEGEEDIIGEPAVFERLPYPMNPEQPLHLIEPGTLPFQGLSYPSGGHWKEVERILENYIYFTTSSIGPHKPSLNTHYLVGRTPYIYPNRAMVLTDYMLSYEHNPKTNVYEWRRLMSTYYHKSPIPHHVNLFYPYPLPLQFE